MKKIFVTVAIFSLVLFQAVAQTPKVYVGGSYKDNNWDDRACYWVNGNMYIFGGASVDAIVEYNGKIYIAGVYKKEYTSGKETKYICYYWIDGIPKELRECKSVDKIMIDNGIVYVFGKNENNDPCFWVNGIYNSVPSDGTIRNMTVINGVVYFAGYYTVGEWPNNTFYACYWTNGVRHDLANSKDFAATTGIEVINGHIYIGAIDNPNRRACYWINGVQHMITNTEDLLIDAFTVSNEKVYMMGRRHYYINGVRHEFNYEGYFYNNVFNMEYTVVRDKIYIAGAYFNEPVYWIDGAHYALNQSNDISPNRPVTISIKTIFVAK